MEANAACCAWNSGPVCEIFFPLAKKLKKCFELNERKVFLVLSLLSEENKNSIL